MNCPQCQTANTPGAAFCGNCGAQTGGGGAGQARRCRLRPPQGTPAPLGYGAASAPAGYDAPTGYTSDGYNAAGGYDNAGGYNPGHAAAARVPAGAVPAPGGGGSAGSAGSSLPPVNFDLNRATPWTRWSRSRRSSR